MHIDKNRTKFWDTSLFLKMDFGNHQLWNSNVTEICGNPGYRNSVKEMLSIVIYIKSSRQAPVLRPLSPPPPSLQKKNQNNNNNIKTLIRKEFQFIYRHAYLMRGTYCEVLIPFYEVYEETSAKFIMIF